MCVGDCVILRGCNKRHLDAGHVIQLDVNKMSQWLNADYYDDDDDA